MYKRLSVLDKEEQTKRLREAGAYLRGIRTGRKLSLAEVAGAIGCSTMFLSEIETAKKPPSEETIHSLASYYELDEVELADMYGKLPIAALEELRESEVLRDTLTKIAKSDLSDAKKRRLYEHLRELYLEANKWN